MSKGLVWSLLATFVGAVGTLLVTPILVRALGAAEFGVYLLVIAVASYSSFFDFGFAWVATRYFAQDLASGDKQDLCRRFRTVETLFWIIGLACALTGVLIAAPLGRAAKADQSQIMVALLVSAFSFALTLQGQLHASLLRAAQRFTPAGAISALGNFLLPVFSYAGVKYHPSLLLLLWANAGVNVISLAVYTWVNRLQLKGGPLWCFNAKYLRQMAHFGGWSTVSKLVQMVVLQVDRLAVALVGTVSGLTYYAVPANLASKVNLLGSPSASLFFARSSALFAAGDRAEVSVQLARNVRLLLWSAVALSAPLVALGPTFLRVWIGPEMQANGGRVLIVFAVAYALISVSGIYSVTIDAAGHYQWNAISILAWSFPAIGIAILGLPYLGFTAIAVGAASWMIGVSLTCIVMARVLGFSSQTRSWLGAFAAGGAVVMAGRIITPYPGNPLAVLGCMSILGVLSLGLGWLTVLRSPDRAELQVLFSRGLADLQRTRHKIQSPRSTHIPIAVKRSE